MGVRLRARLHFPSSPCTDRIATTWLLIFLVALLLVLYLLLEFFPWWIIGWLLYWLMRLLGFVVFGPWNYIVGRLISDGWPKKERRPFSAELGGTAKGWRTTVGEEIQAQWEVL